MTALRTFFDSQNAPVVVGCVLLALVVVCAVWNALPRVDRRPVADVRDLDGNVRFYDRQGVKR